MSSQSAQLKFYNSHKEQILAYKKKWYAKKTCLAAAFKKVRVKGLSKKTSNDIIKAAIKANILTLLLNVGDESKEYSLHNFIELYKFEDFSIIEVNGYAIQYIKDEAHLYYENLSELSSEVSQTFINLPHAKIQLHIFENQLILEPTVPVKPPLVS